MICLCYLRLLQQNYLLSLVLVMDRRKSNRLRLHHSIQTRKSKMTKVVKNRNRSSRDDMGSPFLQFLMSKSVRHLIAMH